MIPVDLNRLREAADYMEKEWAGELWDAHTAIGARPVLRATHRAVLDAPTVWWCEAYKTAYRVACGHAPDVGCRMVALVSVKGES